MLLTSQGEDPLIRHYLAFRGSPCAGEPGRLQPIEPVWSFPQCWQSSGSGSQTESRARGSQKPTTVGSTFHYLLRDQRVEELQEKPGWQTDNLWLLIPNLCCQLQWIPECFRGGAWWSGRSQLPGTRTFPLWMRRSSRLRLRPSSGLATLLQNGLSQWSPGGRWFWPQFAGRTEADLWTHRCCYTHTKVFQCDFTQWHSPEPEPDVDRSYMRSCSERSLAG